MPAGITSRGMQIPMPRGMQILEKRICAADVGADSLARATRWRLIVAPLSTAHTLGKILRKAGDSNPIRRANPGLPVISRSRRLTASLSRRQNTSSRLLAGGRQCYALGGYQPFGGSCPSSHDPPFWRVVVVLGGAPS